MDVILKNKTAGVLEGNKDYVFRLPRGGGVVDLKDFVVSQKGTFFLKARVQLNFNARKISETQEDLPGLKVFFLSNSKRRTIDSKSWGSGCNKYMDVTNFFYETIGSDGMAINATEKRYISVLGGTFFYVYPTAEGLYLASIGFEDTRYPEYHCRA